MNQRPWQVWLLVVLMSITGSGWLMWASLPERVSPALPDLPVPIVVVGGLMHLAGAWGLWVRRTWGWVIALLYMSIGAVSLLSQLAAMLVPMPRFLFLPEAVALLAAPYLIRNRERFFGDPVRGERPAPSR